MAQTNPVVGDLAANAADIARIVSELAARDAADLVIFPELALTGYPPEDLLLRSAFVDEVDHVLRQLIGQLALPAVVGAPLVPARWGLHVSASADSRDRSPLAPSPFPVLVNGAVVAHRGEVLGVATKRFLPNYGVFDERRYFYPGEGPATVVTVAGARCGVVICEDVWVDGGPAREAAAEADIVLAVNASPFARGRRAERHALIAHHARASATPFIYLNLVGGQDELIFDGASFTVNAHGEVTHEMPSGAAAVQIVTLAEGEITSDEASSPLRDELGEIYHLLALATRDYLVKNGCDHVVLGLSGGVDSALVATIAADALGPDAVTALALPSRYSSDHSLSDAQDLATRQGLSFVVAPIEAGHQAVTNTMTSALGREWAGLPDENLQSRLRGVILMAWSNATGALVLTCGNKSELAVGYSTLYGDTAGAFAVIKDVPKTLVYALCEWRNQRDGVEVIPRAILDKAPSAELRPDQRDDQSLPPYDLLDAIIERYVDRDLSVREIVGEGFDADLVARIARLIDVAEFKRRQSPLGPRISGKSFGKDRRLPLTQRAPR